MYAIFNGYSQLTTPGLSSVSKDKKEDIIKAVRRMSVEAFMFCLCPFFFDTQTPISQTAERRPVKST